MEEIIIYTPDEIAQILKMGKRSVYKLMHLPDFPLIRIGNKLYVKPEDLNEYLESYKGGRIPI